jgi:hypothetical protein
MNQVLVDLTVASIAAATKFYCEELALFDFRQDHGMGTVSVVHKANQSILLLLSEGEPAVRDRPVFWIEVDSCESIFTRLKTLPFDSGGRLQSEEVLEYPLERNFSLRDPSGNMFVLFESAPRKSEF